VLEVAATTLAGAMPSRFEASGAATGLDRIAGIDEAGARALSVRGGRGRFILTQTRRIVAWTTPKNLLTTADPNGRTRIREASCGLGGRPKSTPRASTPEHL